MDWDNQLHDGVHSALWVLLVRLAALVVRNLYSRLLSVASCGSIGTFWVRIAAVKQLRPQLHFCRVKRRALKASISSSSAGMA